ncbi:hypothetical protein ONZ45_g6399 [Pleurotus djamor]|nr:hypothetical protein ONZ45_g6399 [Pleurotus djamor]
MDVDQNDEQHTLAPILSYFETSNATFPWRGGRPQEIERRRAQLNDVFIFDLILAGGGVRNSDTLFPPHDVTGLEDLLAGIESSNYDTLKKEGLIYWLLKWHMDGRELKFSEDRCIPPQLVALSDAYWCLDAGVDIPRAVSILSDARLNRDFVSKILQSISTAPDASSLILKYVRTAKPVLTEPDDIDFESDTTRERLIRNLVGWCLTPKPKHHALAQLLTFPMNSYEENLLRTIACPSSAGRELTYLSQIPRLSRLAQVILQDLICTRLIQCGRFSDAIKADKEFSASVPAGQPSIRDDDVSLVQARVQERNKTMREVYASLPTAERMLLDMDLEGPSSMNAAVISTNGQAQAAEDSSTVDLSMSWEDVRLPLPSSSKSTLSHNKPAPRKSAAGLFDSISSPHHPVAASSQVPLLASSIISAASTSSKPGLGDSAILRSSTSGRQSFPYVPVTTAPSHSASRPRVSFPANGPRVSIGSGSTPRPASLFGGSQSSKPPAQFTPANSVRNAFYEPPQTKNKESAFAPRLFDNLPPPAVEPPALHVEDDYASHAQESDQGEDQTEDHDADHSESDAGGLNFSVFSTRPSAREIEEPPVESKPRKISHSATPAPPGHFSLGSLESVEKVEDSGDDEEPRDWDHGAELKRLRTEVHHQHVGGSKDRRPTRISLANDDSAPVSTRRKSKIPTVAKTSKSARSTKKEIEPSNFSRSIPGSLMDDEEEEEKAPAHTRMEEADELAPLPSHISSKNASTRKPRRSRTSLSVSDAGEDDDGAQTRRRSSRLSAAHVSADEGAGKSKGGRTPTTSTRRKR